jgi:Protein of unknown function (DUF3320)
LIDGDRQTRREEQEAERQASERLALTEREAVDLEESPAPGSRSEVDRVNRPPARPYTTAELSPIYAGQDLTAAPASFISQAIIEVVSVEAPLHVTDLAQRVAARWACNLSQRRTARIRAVAEACAREGKIMMKGDFIYAADDANGVIVRSRAGTRIPPERIPPEEYHDAVLTVLRAGDGLDRVTLTKAVRALFGFSRTGPVLEEAIGAAIESLLSEEVIGEGSVGIRLRG